MKIVSLVPSITETLFELGLDNEIAGITTFCILPVQKVKTKIKVGGTKTPDRQKILQLHPDILLMNSEENRKEDADFFINHGLKIHTSLPATVNDAAALIVELGQMFGVQQRAAELSAEIESLAENLQPRKRFRSLILIWKRPYWTVNRTTYVDSICRAVGFDNSFASHNERYPQLNATDIRNSDPEAVLFPDEPYVFKQKDLEEFAREFPDLPAVKANRLLNFDGKYVTWHGYRTMIALKELPAVLTLINK
jgi:ABC-type Fe3+-hydroxamate transport system substrate-binding protein